MIATNNGHINIVLALLAARANVNDKNNVRIHHNIILYSSIILYNIPITVLGGQLKTHGITGLQLSIFIV
jgi:hypothetical protein